MRSPPIPATHPGSRSAALALLAGLAAAACDAPHADVVFENDYSPLAKPAFVVYRATWETATLQSPLLPGAASEPQASVVASANTAYALIAPGWDPTGPAPTSFIVLRSQQGFALHEDNTLHVPVDDQTFVGDCAAGSALSQAEADTITELVFPDVFAGQRYDAATCTTTPLGDALDP